MTPRHTRDGPSPIQRSATSSGYVHITRRIDKSRACDGNKIEQLHNAHWQAWGLLGGQGAEERLSFPLLTLFACYWRSQGEGLSPLSS
jgi:hypothetical protein